jgi:monovalent cation/hydrogen antiporter
MLSVEALVVLTAVMVALVLLARRLQQPFPIVLVIGGLLLGFVPDVSPVHLRSEDVFLIFLPPLLFMSAFTTSWRDFTENLRPILRLAVGLVLVTAGGVALVAHALIPGLSWPAAFVLGAIVAPTDPVATEAIAERLPLPRRILVILQGESLVNDATAIVIFRIALGVALGGTFSVGGALGSFLLVSVGGLAVGLAVAWGVAQVRHHLPEDASVENTVSLLAPLLAYLPAEHLHVSGILAVFACGIYLGRQDPHLVSARTRLQAVVLWRMVTFLLNGLLFLLVGLQLRQIVHGLPAATPLGALLATAFLISLTVIGTRLLWVFLVASLARALRAASGEESPFTSWQQVAIVAWSGMRGGISLAVALSIPLTFPHRAALVFVTFAVIFVTLVVQGLSLPVLIRALKIVGDPQEQQEEVQARARTVDAAIERLDSLVDEEGIPAKIHEEVRRSYIARHERLSAAAHADLTGEPHDGDMLAYLRLKQEVINAERETIVLLRDNSEISDETLRSIQSDIDMEEARIRAAESQERA